MQFMNALVRVCGAVFFFGIEVHVVTNRQSQLETIIVSECDQEIPQSQTADKPMTLRGRGTQPSRDTKKTN